MGETIFYELNEQGEWEKYYYEQDGLRWTAPDLFGGDFVVTPENARAIHDGLENTILMIPRLLGKKPGTFRAVRNISGRLAAEVVPLPDGVVMDMSTITLEFPTSSEAMVFVEGGEFVPTVNIYAGHHAGFAVRVDENGRVTVVIESYTTMSAGGKLAMSLDNTSTENAAAATQVLNQVLGAQLIDVFFKHDLSKATYINDGSILLYGAEDLTFEDNWGLSPEQLYKLLADPTVLQDAVEGGDLNATKLITPAEVESILIDDPFVPSE